MIAILAPPFALALSPVPVGDPPIVADFVRICLTGDQSVESRVARAAGEGWRSRADGTMTRPGYPSTTTLRIDDTKNGDERMASCGIRSAAGMPRIAAETRAALGFAPALDLGTTATFFVVRDGQGWRSGAALDRAGFAAAKAQGRFASIVAGDTESGSTIYTMSARPEDVSPPH